MTLNAEMQEADIFDESVFALSLTENVAIFNSKGQRTALIPCIVIEVGMFHAHTPYYSGVGYCIVYFAMGSPQPSVR